ncbi:SDR family oxidoreductase [Microbacterium marinilacus]|uniref:SDR family oxidoreductase n=1 Tax=Microbacterium marinilacus TaxID=415209 RepID=A0ABP7B971_9MICO|nr:SDR family oxidoreductase [Microbacterium marinilacus]MBY0687337.1 SDR family oxidoreductase [Microbacterium marinilacus]
MAADDTPAGPSLFRLDGRLALVTGSSRGLGLALALALAEAGARVVLHGRDEAALAAARARLEDAAPGSVADAVRFDVTDSAAVEAGVAAVIAAHGVPDVLVNNAGIQRRAPIAEFDPADWDAVIASNLSSAFYVSRFVTPGMIERGSGKVINIASVQSKLARQTIAPYSASKGGVALLTQGMAADLARHNVQVNAISPGYFATEMNRALVEDEAFNAWLVNRTPAHRWGDFRELSGTLLYLASDASSFVSGQNIFVDGGMTAVV